MASRYLFLYTFIVLTLHVLLAFSLPATSKIDPNQPRNSTSPTKKINAPLLGNITFAAEPAGRGTWGIIFSSTATFIFCVWTAVHPNIIPSVKDGYRIYYRAVLTIVSVVVPEGMIMCAFSQWLEAKEVKKNWDTDGRFYKDQKLKEYLGMDGAFFVVMGGFVVDVKPGGTINHPEPAHVTKKLTKLPLDDNPKYTTTLTASGFVDYLKEGLIDETSFDKKAIVDKGKANNVAKILSGTQAIWLIIQSISRWKADMRITLLEIHVLIQVICTVIIYLSWWSKPFDVNEPLVIKIWKTKVGDTVGEESKSREVTEFDEGYVRNDDMKTRLSTNRIPPNLIGVLEKGFYDIISCIGHSEQSARKNKGKLWPMLAEGTLVTINGLLHVAAWHVHFPSEVELWMWRGSSFGMCVFPLIVVFIAMGTSYHQDLIDALWDFQQCKMTIYTKISKAIRRINKVAKKHAKKEGEKVNFWRYLYNLLLIKICFLFLLIYLICILFITVESYISIRDPPQGVFLTPRWNDYWPHL